MTVAGSRTSSSAVSDPIIPCHPAPTMVRTCLPPAPPWLAKRASRAPIARMASNAAGFWNTFAASMVSSFVISEIPGLSLASYDSGTARAFPGKSCILATRIGGLPTPLDTRSSCCRSNSATLEGDSSRGSRGGARSPPRDLLPRSSCWRVVGQKVGRIRIASARPSSREAPAISLSDSAPSMLIGSSRTPDMSLPRAFCLAPCQSGCWRRLGLQAHPITQSNWDRQVPVCMKKW
jgi:hypothetical protein